MHASRSIVAFLLVLLVVVSVAAFGASWKWKKKGASEAGWTWDERVQTHVWVN